MARPLPISINIESKEVPVCPDNCSARKYNSRMCVVSDFILNHQSRILLVKEELARLIPSGCPKFETGKHGRIAVRNPR